MPLLFPSPNPLRRLSPLPNVIPRDLDVDEVEDSWLSSRGLVSAFLFVSLPLVVISIVDSMVRGKLLPASFTSGNVGDLGGKAGRSIFLRSGLVAEDFFIELDRGGKGCEERISELDCDWRRRDFGRLWDWVLLLLSDESSRDVTDSSSPIDD